MPVRRSRKRHSRSRSKYGRKKSVGRRYKSRSGPKRRSRKRSQKRSRKRSQRRSRKRYNYNMASSLKINMRDVDKYLAESRLINPNIIGFMNDGNLIITDKIQCYSKYQTKSLSDLFDKLFSYLEFSNLDDYYVMCPIHGGKRYDCYGKPHIQFGVTGTYNTKDGPWNPMVTHNREVFEELGVNIKNIQYNDSFDLTLKGKKKRQQSWNRYIVNEYDITNQTFLEQGRDNRALKIMSIVYNKYDKIVNDLRKLQVNHIINRNTVIDNWRFLKNDNLIGVAAVKLSYILFKLNQNI